MSFDSPRRARRLAALAALAAVPFAAANASAAPLPIPGPTLWAGSWETGNTSQWSGCQKTADYSIQIQSNLVREGARAARFEVHDGDNPIGSGERSECQKTTGEVEGSERWYSWSTYFAPDFPVSNSTSGWATFTQWHANASTGSPPLGFYLEGGKMVLKMHRQSSPASYLSINTPWGMDFASNRGRWIDFNMRVKWSGSDSVGWAELWVDGVKQRMNWPAGGNAAAYGGLNSYRATGRTLVPGYGAYIKQGFYRCVCLDGTAVIYHDGFATTDAAGDGDLSTTTPPPPSTTVTVAPASVSLGVGATQQFTASGAVTWSVNGVAGGNGSVGTISSTGLYTAPSAVPTGAVTVTGTTGAGQSASAAVTVTAPTTPPVTPPPSGTTVFSDGFEGGSLTGSGWTTYTSTGGTAAVVGTPVASGAKAADFNMAGTGNVAYASRGFAAKQNVALTMKVLLRNNTLAKGDTTVLARVLNGYGSALASPRFEVGLTRRADGSLRWAAWSMTTKRVFSAAVLSPTAPELGRWYTLRLATDWNSAASGARLMVDDGTDIATPAVNMSGFSANRVEVGVPWTNSANRLRVGIDDLQMANAGTGAAARVRSAGTLTRLRIGRAHGSVVVTRPRPRLR